MGRLDTKEAGNAQAQVESELTRVEYALATSEDARHKGESALTRAQHALVASEKAR